MSPMTGGGMPRPSPAALAAFQALVPEAAGVTTRPMFGNQAAFLNGNMFAGLFGDALFVRLDAEEVPNGRLGRSAPAVNLRPDVRDDGPGGECRAFVSCRGRPRRSALGSSRSIVSSCGTRTRAALCRHW